MSTVADAVPALGGAPGRSPGALVRNGLAVAITLTMVVLLVRERAALDAGSDSVAGADRAWLVLAATGILGLWTAGTVSQLGSVPVRLPFRRLFAVQVAAGFANHVLPAGCGGMAVNVRFLHRHGLSRPAAVGSVALNLLAGTVTHTALLVVAVVLAPASLTAAYERRGPGGPPAAWPLLVAAGLPLAGLLAWAVRRWGARGLRHVRDQLGTLGAVLRTPARAAQLWLGSLAVPILHCLTLWAVLRSLGGTVPLVPLALAYLVASAVAALLPSPGGFGALDVTLVGGLVAVGAPAALALATVLAYRLLTVWVPLLPGACMLAVLLRRRVI
ncbi:MAG TPA: lysylphosphatidylglycerol synthase transmembrane domain-containing protein [Mycobacteriales bacterium]|nr:lysylphosphatidylglycerol synthase transmembrane domain-containing protein [Mycobacteriales bacterium]